MATKFITIRIPIPNFGRGVEEDDYEELAKRLELDMQIRDIRRRIEKLRSHFHTPRRRKVEDPPKLDERPQETTKEEQRNSELNALKAKLMGGKK